MSHDEDRDLDDMIATIGATRRRPRPRVVPALGAPELVRAADPTIGDADDEPRRAWRTPGQRARALGGMGLRIGTSFDTFDKATRGGIPASKLVVIGGAPGAGKTTWSVQTALLWAQAGVHVAIFAADEDADAVLVRLGQLLGFSRELLEDGDVETRESLALQLEALPNLMLVDAAEEGALLEEVSAELYRVAAGAQTALVVDSVQTVKVFGVELADGPRARIDLVMEALKREAKQKGHRVIAICELNRGAYRSQDAAERVSDLAAFKESGGIEYAASVAVVMRSVSGSNALVDVSMPKNRLGQKLPFRMELSFTRAMFTEVDLPSDDVDSPTEKMKLRILEVVEKAIAPIKSKNELARRSKGKKTVVFAALDELLEESTLEWSKGVLGTGSRGSQVVPGTGAAGGPVPGSPPIGREPIPGTAAERRNRDV